MRGRSRFRVAVVFALVAAITLLISGAAAATAKGQRIRWDIISVNFATGTLSAGGQASSLAADGSKITLTGHGTFRTNRGHSLDVTGGGSWATFDKNGNAIGRGTYAVARFVSFELAPGTPPLRVCLAA